VGDVSSLSVATRRAHRPEHLVGTSADARRDTDRPTWIEHAIAASIYLGFSLWIWHHVLPHLGSKLNAGGLSDQGLFVWFINWGPFAVLHGHNPFYTHYLNAPTGVSMMWNTSILGLSIGLAPLTLLFGPIVVYNLICILGPTLSAWACFTWIRRYVMSLPALVGGMIFGFSPFVRGQSYGHLCFIWLCFIPIIAMLLEDLYWRSNRPWWMTGGLLGLVCVVQALISEEMLLMTAMAAAVATAGLCIVYRREVRQHLSQAVKGLGCALLVAVPLLAYPLYTQLSPGNRIRGAINGPDYYETQLRFLVTAPPWVVFHTTAGALSVTRAVGVEDGVYIGVPLLVLLGVFAILFGARRKLLLAALGFAAFFGVLSLGGRAASSWGRHRGPTLPWGYIEHAVGLLRDTETIRFAVIIWLAIALAFALGLDQVLRRSTGVGRLASVVVCIACLVPLIPTVPSADKIVATPSFFTTAAVHAIPHNSISLVVPMPDEEYDAALTWQVRSGMWFAQPGGYILYPVGPNHVASSHAGPPVLNQLLSAEVNHRFFAGPVTAKLRQQALEEISASHCSTAVLPEGFSFTPGLKRTLESVLGRPPDTTVSGVDIWYLTAH
jgi:hypothetical protein